jgi:hypothetical protein
MRPFIVRLFLLILLTSARLIAMQNKLHEMPLSRAERTDYAETSRYSDVMDFIAELQRLSSLIRVEQFATTNEGRALPLVILSKPAIHTPAEAVSLERPIVFIMANIHAGEVEGKEAAQHLMRDLVAGPLSPLLDKMVLLIAPIYNADGNERISINNRVQQNGPLGGVGTRENAQGLDLNRDFMKLETPEARGLVSNVFNKWDPQVIIDLHTTDGSYHGYALTYSPALNPNADRRVISFVRDKLLPQVSKSLREKYGYRTYFYGNFADASNRELPPEQLANAKAWVTFDHRPRFGNNYEGLRNRLAILSEAYSYLDFRKRVDVTDKFVRAILQYIAEHTTEVIRAVRDSDQYAIETGTTSGNEDGFGITFEKVPSQRPVRILAGSVTKTIDPRTNKARLQATDEVRPVEMIEYGQFRATRRLRPPVAYLLKPNQQAAIDMLLRHGITVEVLTRESMLDVQRYRVKQLTHASFEFQHHRETKLSVAVEEGREVFPEGSFIVSMHQPKAALIFYLLEPESDDGLAAWNFFDPELERVIKGSHSPVYPVYRLNKEPRAPRLILSR